MSKVVCSISVLVLYTALAGCSRQTSIWVREGSSADSLVFELGRKRGRAVPIAMGFIRVDRCESLRASPGVIPPVSQAAWVLEGIPQQAAEISSVRYGAAVPGYRELQPPAALERSGCYVVAISGTGETGFKIDPSGRITELDEAELTLRTEP
jgi:hypothetical protein